MLRCLRIDGCLDACHKDGATARDEIVLMPSISGFKGLKEDTTEKQSHTIIQQAKRPATIKISASSASLRPDDVAADNTHNKRTVSGSPYADPMLTRLEAPPGQESVTECRADSSCKTVKPHNKLSECSNRLKALLQQQQQQRVAPVSYLEDQEQRPILQKPASLPSSATAARLTLLNGSRPSTTVASEVSVSATELTGYSIIAKNSTLHPYIHHHGRSIMSLSTLQHGLQHFIVPGVGYIAYALMYNGPPVLNIRTAVALGDPVCDPQQYQSMAQAFLKQHPKAMFAQVSKAFAVVLSNLGLLVNALGGETSLDVEKYTFSGYAKRGLRSAIASAVKEGVTVHEVMRAPLTFAPTVYTTADGAPAGPTAADKVQHGNCFFLAEEMREVDQLWVGTKGQHASKVWFLNRQPVFAPETGVRKFIARDGSGRLQAFIFLDAVYDSGNITGYYANVTRMRPDAHPGVLNLIIKEVIDRLRCESNLEAPAKQVSIKKSRAKKQQINITANAATAATGALAQYKASAVTTLSVNIHCSSTMSSLSGTDNSSNNSSGSSTSSSINMDTAISRSSTGSSCGTRGSNNSSGIKFLSLGMSPFCSLDDSAFKHSSRMRYWLDFAFKHGTVFYPAKSLAAAKAKYGAGLHNGRYEDPNATYTQVYLAHNHHSNTAAAVALHNLFRMTGIWDHPVNTVTSYLRHKIKKKVAKARQQTDKQHKQQQQKQQ